MWHRIQLNIWIYNSKCSAQYVIQTNEKKTK